MNSTLLNYVKQTLEAGHTTDEVKQILLANGWAESEINQTLAFIQLQKQAPMPPPIPVPIPPMSGTTNSRQTYRTEPSSVSAYSGMLAVLLFVCLLILTNNIISDVQSNFSADVNSRLIFDAIIIIPFLLVAGGLHLFFHDRKEKFLVLSYPYYIVAGWLTLRLLFYVSEYILSSVATYGVYIVLIMVVVVLTATVFLIQRFMKEKK